MLAKLHGRSIQPWLAGYQIQAPDISITDLVLDSREVAIHKAFVAIKGHSLDGRDFIPQAISLGAKVILTECEQAAEHGQLAMREQSLIVPFYQLSEQLSQLAADFYRHPADKLDVIAVTGTNGKTSTVQFVTQLRHKLGEKSASIGTLGAGILQPDAENAGLQATLNTTPDAVQMQRMLADFTEAGSGQVALEASSHALVQGRIKGLRTDVAVFTNLSRDHLDYHGSMQAYANAKRLLLSQPGLSKLVLNMDDPESRNWLVAAPEGVRPVLVGLHTGKDALPDDCQYCLAEQVSYHTQGCRVTLSSSWGDAELSIPLLGHFNVVNALAAVAVQLMLGQSLQALIQACAELQPVPGRMEVFNNAAGANIVVDYAHSPDALEQALIAARHHCAGKLVCIFGCGGDRDQGKRPLMGEVAERLSDQVVITTDNSRSEAPEQIVKDILAGCQQPQRVHNEPERKQAIRWAAEQFSQRDLILLAGKGHETNQIIGTQTLAYNEREYVKHLLAEKQP